MEQMEEEINQLHATLESRGINSRRTADIFGREFELPVNAEHKAVVCNARTLCSTQQPHMRSTRGASIEPVTRPQCRATRAARLSARASPHRPTPHHGCARAWLGSLTFGGDTLGTLLTSALSPRRSLGSLLGGNHRFLLHLLLDLRPRRPGRLLPPLT